MREYLINDGEDTRYQCLTGMHDGPMSVTTLSFVLMTHLSLVIDVKRTIH